MTDKPLHPITDEHDLYDSRPVVETEQPEEFIEPAHEKKELTSTQRLAIILAGVALASGIVGGVTVNALSQRQPTATEAPANPANQTSTGEVKPDTQNVPAEAKSFVEEYGSMYSDPVSTYYAEKTYEEAGYKSVMLTKEYIANYDPNVVRDRISHLGLESYSLPLSKVVDQATAVEIFDKYTAKELAIYMNALSKNPTTEAVTIIDAEFLNYCSDTNNADAFTVDDEYIMKLMETAKSIVAKYGSNASFDIIPGSSDLSDTGMSYIGSPITMGRDESGAPQIYSNNANIAMNVYIFDGVASTVTKDKIKNIQLVYIRQQNSDKISIGLLTK